MFDHRCARQNRCELSPEFPLASPYSGIVHHLSGRNSNAFTRIPPQHGNGSVDGAPQERLSPRRSTRPAFIFIAHRPGLNTRTTLATVALLGPCLKTGRMQPASSQAAAAQGVGNPLPGRRAYLGHCTQWLGAALERTEAACARRVQVPPLFPAGPGRSARLAINSPPPGGCATCPTHALRLLPAALGRPETLRVQGCRRSRRKVVPRGDDRTPGLR